MSEPRELTVKHALPEELNDGRVWGPDLGYDPRPIVRIRNRDSGRSVVCEYLVIDHSYVRRYEARNDLDGASATLSPEGSLVLNYWYRRRLGIHGAGARCRFEITRIGDASGWVYACLGHPQIVVRLATVLALLGFGLGCLSVVLALVR